MIGEMPGSFLLSLLSQRRVAREALESEAEHDAPPGCVTVRCTSGAVFYVRTGISRAPDEPIVEKTVFEV
jgi:hypothetical protein